MHNITNITITSSISPLSTILIEQEHDSQQLGLGVGGQNPSMKLTSSNNH